MEANGGERIVVSQLILEGLEDVQEEEDGLACMVCREGYSLRPGDLLGVYSYSKRLNLGVGASGSARGECVYTTEHHSVQIAEGEDESGTLEGWEVVKKDRLLNVKQLLGFSKEMVSWLDEMNSASDLHEAFDVAGILPEVFSGGFSQCEEFVQAAINAGKS